MKAWILLLVFAAATNGDPVSNLPSITAKALTDVMNEETSSGIKAYLSFINIRNALNNPSNNLPNMREFIRNKMSNIVGKAGGLEERHKLDTIDFETNILNSNGSPSRVTGVNYITTLAQKSNDTSEDEPLVIVANYDTDFKEGTNPVEDNGSGLAALLVIANQISQELFHKKYTLKNSVIFAAVDVSFRKYDSHAQGDADPNDQTGADHFAKNFLPNYLRDRKGFKGVIVLDSLMNYDATPRSQGTQGMDKAYPESYQEMSAEAFAGNFLALVARDGSLDEDLIEAFENGWAQSKKQKRANTGNIPEPADPKLIKFIDTAKLVGNGNPAYLHFLKSDQRAFWNHHARTGPMYPAILLTDTRDWRNSTCKIQRCRPDQMYNEAIKDQNLQFAHRTTLAVYETIIKLQSGGLNIEGSIFLYMATVVGVVWRYFHQ